MRKYLTFYIFYDSIYGNQMKRGKFDMGKYDFNVVNFNKIVLDYEERLKYLRKLLKTTNYDKERMEIKEEIDAKTKELEEFIKNHNEYLEKKEQERVLEEERKKLEKINNQVIKAFENPEILKYNIEEFDKAYELYKQADDKVKRKLAKKVKIIYSEVKSYKKRHDKKRLGELEKKVSSVNLILKTDPIDINTLSSNCYLLDEIKELVGGYYDETNASIATKIVEVIVEEYETKYDAIQMRELDKKISMVTSILDQQTVNSTSLSNVRDILKNIDVEFYLDENKSIANEKILKITNKYKNILSLKRELASIKNKILTSKTKEELDEVLNLFRKLETKEDLNAEQKDTFIDLFNSKYKTVKSIKISNDNDGTTKLSLPPKKDDLVGNSQFLLPPKGGSSYNNGKGANAFDIHSLRMLPPRGGSSYRIISQYQIQINRLIAEAYLKPEEALEVLEEAEKLLNYVENNQDKNALKDKIKEAKDKLLRKKESPLDLFIKDVEDLKKNIFNYEDEKVIEKIDALKLEFEKICKDSRADALIDVKEYLNILNDIIFKYNKKKNDDKRKVETKKLYDQEIDVKSDGTIYALNAKRIIDKLFKKTDDNFMNTIKVLKSKNKLEKLKYKLYKNGFSNMNRTDKDTYEKSQNTVAKNLLKYLMNKEVGLREYCKDWAELFSIMPDKLRVYKKTYTKDDVLKMTNNWFKEALKIGEINEKEYDFYMSLTFDIAKYRNDADDYYFSPDGSSFVTYIEEEKITSFKKA